MTTPVIAFFNNKGGVGKTSIVFHVAHMLTELGIRVTAADLDPQGNLSAAFLSEERLEELWPQDTSLATIYGSIAPIKRGTGDILDPILEKINESLTLIPGDMGLSDFEDDLSQVWPKCLDRDERAFRVISAMWRVLQRAAIQSEAKVILVDLGPNLGAINRAALIAADYVIMPMSPDLFSIQGLKNSGPRLRTWRKEWQERLLRNPTPELELPNGSMEPIGYVVTQHNERKNRPVKSYQKWISRIPAAYRIQVLDEMKSNASQVSQDRNCLAMLKHYRSLMAMAQEAGKPIFKLKPADGALGAHTYAVRQAYEDFKKLTLKIIKRLDLEN